MNNNKDLISVINAWMRGYLVVNSLYMRCFLDLFVAKTSELDAIAHHRLVHSFLEIPDCLILQRFPGK